MRQYSALGQGKVQILGAFLTIVFAKIGVSLYRPWPLKEPKILCPSRNDREFGFPDAARCGKRIDRRNPLLRFQCGERNTAVSITNNPDFEIGVVFVSNELKTC